MILLSASQQSLADKPRHAGDRGRPPRVTPLPGTGPSGWPASACTLMSGSGLLPAPCDCSVAGWIVCLRRQSGPIVVDLLEACEAANLRRPLSLSIISMLLSPKLRTYRVMARCPDGRRFPISVASWSASRRQIKPAYWIKLGGGYALGMGYLQGRRRPVRHPRPGSGPRSRAIGDPTALGSLY